MSRRGRWRRVVIGASGVLATGVVAAAATGFSLLNGGDPAQPDSDLPPRTAPVTRQTLVDRKTVDGALGYAAPAVVRARLQGTVTALPASGSTVECGQSLYEVDDKAVVLLYGSLPAYRALEPGIEGADVAQFEQNLHDLGYRGFTVDTTYSTATATAVKAWQRDRDLAETGTVELGRIAYAAGAVRVDSLAAAVGDPVQPGGEVLTLTGTTRVVTVELDMADQRLAVKDAAVTMTPPAGGTVPGRIGAVTTVVSTSEGSGASDDGGSGGVETKIEVTVTTDDQQSLSGLNEATVTVGFTAATRENVLTVPVAALLALAEGGYGVQVVTGERTEIVAVGTGMFADGRVEVSGGGLAEGTIVGIPS